MGLLNFGKKKTAKDPDLDDLTVEDATYLRQLFATHWPAEAGALTMHGEYAETEGGAQLGLYNLSRTVNAAPRAQWPELVARHIAGLFSQQARPADEDLSDAEIRALVKARVIADTYLPETHRPHFTYRRAIAEGLEAILMLDHPETTTAIPDAIVSRFDAEALWATAIASVLDEQIDTVQTIGEGSESFQVVAGESYFTSSRVLDIPASLTHLGVGPAPHGVLFAVPTRHLVAFHVVSGPEAIHAALGMQQFARTLFAQQPGEISANVYYWREGSTEQAMQVDDEGRAQVHDTSAFFAAINGF